MARILLRLLILVIVLGVFLMVRDSLKDDPLELQDSKTSRIVTEAEIIPDLIKQAELERQTIEIVADPQPQVGTPVEDGLEVQVVDMESKEPVPNAVVLLMNMERMEDDAEVMPDLHNYGIEYLAHRYGIQYSTDEQGRTKIPKGEEPRLFLAAKADGAFGAQNVDTESDEAIVIAIGPTSVLHAHVVDASGVSAADVSVFLVSNNSRGSRPFLQAKTDAQGLATLRIPAIYLQEFPEDMTLVVEPESYSPLKESVEVDPHQLPSEPVELRLPPCGKVRILVTDSNGKLHQDMCNVRFALEDHAAHEGPIDRLAWDAPSTRRQFVGGETVFDNVGLHAELWVQVSNEDGTSTATTMPVGPTTAGETVDVHLALAPVRPVIVGQVLDLEGKHVGRADMLLKVETYERNGSGYSSTTHECNKDGRFRYSLSSPAPEPDSMRVLVIRYEDDTDGIRGEARYDLMATYPNGETDIGQMRLQPLPLLVSGQALDTDGQAIAEAHWSIQKQLLDQEGNPTKHWTDQRQSSGYTDGDGYFRLLKHVPAGSYRVAVSASGHTKGFAPFTVGQEDVQVILGGAQDIHGRILVDEGISYESMSVSIAEKSEQQIRTFGGPDGFIEEDGSFRFPDRGTGTYEIKLTTRKTNEALIEPLTVHVDSSVPFEPVTIDLRGLLVAMEIHVVDEQGNPIRGNSLCIPEVAPGRIGTGDASKKIITSRPGMELQVSAPGKRTASLPILAGEKTVVLKEGYPVEISAANPSVLPEGYFLGGQLMKAGPDGGASKRLWLGEMFPFSDGVASLSCPESGDLYIQLQVAEKPAEGDDDLRMALYRGRRIRSETFPTTRLKVQDVEGLQTFTISIDEEELAATMEYWERAQKR